MTHQPALRVGDLCSTGLTADSHARHECAVAGAAGLDAPTLNKTFEPNSTRHLRLRTVMAIGAVAGADARRTMLTPVARLFGFSLEAAKPLTPEQELRELREWMARKAAGLLDDFDATRGR